MESYEALTQNINNLEKALAESKLKRDAVKKLSLDKQLALYMSDRWVLGVSVQKKNDGLDWAAPESIKAVEHANRMLDTMTVIYYRNQPEANVDSGTIYNQCISILRCLE